MGIKTVPQPPDSPDLAACDFWLLPKLRGCRYETIEKMKEAVTKVIDTLTQEGFHGAFQKLMERYNKWTAAGGDYFEGDLSFMCVLSIKVPIRKKSGNLFNDPRIVSCACNGKILISFIDINYWIMKTVECDSKIILNTLFKNQNPLYLRTNFEKNSCWYIQYSYKKYIYQEYLNLCLI